MALPLHPGRNPEAQASCREAFIAGPGKQDCQ